MIQYKQNIIDSLGGTSHAVSQPPFGSLNFKGMSNKIEYKEGEVINGLAYLHDIENGKPRERVAMFKCYCGNKFKCLINSVKTRHTNSCGCYQKEQLLKANTKHGDSSKNNRHYLYELWRNIKARCFNKNGFQYNYYGGRGIKMFALWINSYPIFKSYILDTLGERPTPKHSLDRIDNDGNYEPNNIRWVRQPIQSVNQRKRETNTTGYTGIYFYKRDKIWAAEITVNYKHIHIGRYPTKDSALMARNRYITENDLPHKIQSFII